GAAGRGAEERAGVAGGRGAGSGRRPEGVVVASGMAKAGVPEDGMAKEGGKERRKRVSRQDQWTRGRIRARRGAGARGEGR
ncbi:hypothetical protein B1218_35310, partial [Pseudomonas ogarae]